MNKNDISSLSNQLTKVTKKQIDALRKHFLSVDVSDIAEEGKPLSIKQINEVRSKDITIKQRDEIEDLIGNRIMFIINVACKVFDVKLSWWSFPNSYDGNNMGDIDMCVNPNHNSLHIELEMDDEFSSYIPKWLGDSPKCLEDGEIPKQWLSLKTANDIKRAIVEFQFEFVYNEWKEANKKKQQRLDRKEIETKIIKSILSKVSPEEQKYLSRKLRLKKMKISI